MTPSRIARWGLPALALLVAAGVGIATRANDPSSGSPSTTTEPAPLAVESESQFQFDSLDELVAASDLVVRARVESVERGRVFGSGDASGAAIVSRQITLAVSEVLAGPVDVPRRVVVAEEGWLPDGTPLIVDGLRIVEPGDQAIWFLDAVDDPDFPGFVVVNYQGRYLVDGERLEGAGREDPLVRELAALTPSALADRIR